MNFIIDQVSWHTKVQGNPESREQIISRFWSVVDFLQRRELTTRSLLNQQSEIDEAFSIQSDDLTSKGLDLMKKVYDKWLVKVDEGMSSTDMSMFEKQLSKLQSIVK
jgi:hypothetical protein